MKNKATMAALAALAALAMFGAAPSFARADTGCPPGMRLTVKPLSGVPSCVGVPVWGSSPGAPAGTGLAAPREMAGTGAPRETRETGQAAPAGRFAAGPGNWTPPAASTQTGSLCGEETLYRAADGTLRDSKGQTVALREGWAGQGAGEPEPPPVRPFCAGPGACGGGQHAGPPARMRADYAAYFASTPAGNRRAWGGGVLVRTGPGATATYYPNGESSNYGAVNIDPNTDLNWLAQQNDALGAEFKAHYGFEPSPTYDQQVEAWMKRRREAQSRRDGPYAGLVGPNWRDQCGGGGYFSSGGSVYTADGRMVRVVGVVGVVGAGGSGSSGPVVAPPMASSGDEPPPARPFCAGPGACEGGQHPGPSARMRADYAAYFASTPVGNRRAWGGGVLVRTGPGATATYYPHGESTNYGAVNIDPNTDLNWLAQQNDALGAEFKANYGFEPSPTYEQQMEAWMKRRREAQSRR